MDQESTGELIEQLHERQAGSLAAHFAETPGDSSAKLQAFPRYVDRTSQARYLVRYDIFREILEVQGSVVECGVFDGAGTFAFATFSTLLEPLNHRRQVIGFDTFSGFPAVHDHDRAGGSGRAAKGQYAGSGLAPLQESIRRFDVARPLAQFPKVELVAGDFMQTGPDYLQRNQHLVIALLYLDFDLYEPTKLALELFLPRIPAGGVVAFDEVHVPGFPGETLALLETLGIRSIRLQRRPFTSICWARL